MSPNIDLTRRALIFLSIAAIFVFAIWQRATLPLVPISDPDTWGYLRPALTALAGEGMVQTHSRSFGYPAFLLMPLAVGGTFESIVVWQHSAGLLAGLAWWWIWCQLTSLLPTGFVQRWIAPIIGLLALFAFLCGAQRVIDEVRLRPEAIFPLFALLQIGTLVAWFRERCEDKRLPLEAVWATLTLFLTFATYSLKPSWGLAVLIPPALFALGCIGGGGRRTLATVAACAIAAASFLSLPSLLGWKKETGASVFLPMLLVGVHADIISKHLDQKAQTGELSSPESDFALHLAKHLSKSRSNFGFYEILGFDPDYLMFHSDAFAPLPGPSDPISRKSAYYTLFLSALAARPLDFASKWTRQIGAVYFQNSKALFRESIALAQPYESSIGTLPPATMPLPPRLAQAYNALRTGATAPDVAEKVRLAPSGTGDLGRAGGFLLFPGNVTVLVLTAFVAWNALWRRSLPVWSQAAAAASVIALSALLSNLTVAFIHSFDIVRYLHLLAPLNWLIVSSAVILISVLAEQTFLKKS